MFSSVLSFILAGEVPIYLETDMEIGIDVRFLFGRFTTKRVFSKDCGLKLRMRSGTPEAGPMACAGSFERLRIPAFGAGAGGGGLQLDALALAEEELERGRRAKNLGLGVAMAVGFGLGLVLLCGGAVTLARTRWSQKCSQARDLVEQRNATSELRAAPIGAAQPATEGL